MSLHDKYQLTRIINAAGTFTPLGVSRSTPAVAESARAALSEFVVIDELQDAVSAAIARFTGAEAGAVTHCVAAGITLSVAAAMGGKAPDRVARLPDTSGLPNRVVLPAAHAIDYGHPIEQDIRLAGAQPVLVGSDEECGIEDIDVALGHEDTACLLLVSSRLVRGKPIDMAKAVTAAHRRGVPAIIDGAAQDMRIGELLETGADLVLVSGHKYLASPTAGLVIGQRGLIEAVRAQETGLGRAMKPPRKPSAAFSPRSRSARIRTAHSGHGNRRIKLPNSSPGPHACPVSMHKWSVILRGCRFREHISRLIPKGAG